MNPCRRAVARAAAVMVAAACLTWAASAAVGAGHLSRITVSPDTFNASRPGGVSADGTRIAFESDADLRDENAIASVPAIWLYDTQAATLPIRMTPLTDPSSLAYGSFAPAISADGSHIAFESDLDLIGHGPPFVFSEIWLYDVPALKLRRITSATLAGRDSLNADISADGKTIAFRSDGDFRGEGRPAGVYEIWLYDTTTLTYTRITSASAGGRNSLSPRLSADGMRVAFYSDSDFLNQGIPDNQNEIWLYDTATLTLTRITTSPQAGRDSALPVISHDGTRIVFQSSADFYTQGITTTQQEIWLYTSAPSLTRVTTGTAGRSSQYPRLSGDGGTIVFHSDADLRGQGLVTNQFEVWLFHTAAMTVTRVTTASHAERDSRYPVISADGSRVVFQSDSDFNGEGIPAGQHELWQYTAALRYVYLPVVLKNMP